MSEESLRVRDVLHVEGVRMETRESLQVRDVPHVEGVRMEMEE